MQTVEQLQDLQTKVANLPVTDSLAPAHHNSLLQTIVGILGIVLSELIHHKNSIAAIPNTAGKPKLSAPKDKTPA